MDSLVRDCEKLSKHQTAAMNKTLGSVEATIRALELARTEPGSLGSAQRQCKQTQDAVSEQLKELCTNVAKYGKHVERSFKLDLGVVAESRAFENKQAELGQSIMLHFLRSGDFDLARSFITEDRSVVAEDCAWARFEAMNALAEQIRTHVLEPALEWALANRAALDALGLGLEFALHRLRFLQLVEGGASVAALAYAREWFPRANTGSERLAEITHLMGVFMYARRLGASPYAALFGERRWADGAREFAAAFCAVQGLAAASPLAVSVAAGARALAVVSKVSGLLRERRVEWSQQDELAVEVPLPDAMRFHSVFACPVSKEQASRDNPPMALPCGHVVCKASLDKLARGVRPGAVASGRFKCPYCPGMATAGEAERVHF
ncbi:hypothetical protein GGI03_005975 [Coemansia sp. RSA 2337]|nr:hypothetical protein H4S03_005305 [Coemansia sp. S3946]KAJ2050264.1 hypothetical protein H4S04_002712 [Coemansia sp. S16]KAJ2056863.1 hypothetical protein GGI08_003765 [Coemansia sp. S2]KAJ2352184.1 hypothetical protein GGH92_001404 [Coemansia sp. RSA 2673]KAJ2457878.1 hypothetical protein GGI03_005975 [Coemansia sp. RSA 2337]